MNYYDNQTYYDILGLPKDGKDEITGMPVSIDSIQSARNRLIYGNSGEDSLPFWLKNKIEEAYAVLSDPEKRVEYDKSLAEQVSYDFSSTTSEPQENETENIYSSSDHKVDSLYNDEDSEPQTEDEKEEEKELEEVEEKEEIGSTDVEEEDALEETKEEDKDENIELPENDNYEVFDIDREAGKKTPNFITRTINDKVSSIMKSDNLRKTLVTVAAIGAGFVIAPGFAIVAGIPIAIITNKIIDKVKTSKLYRDHKEKKIEKLYTVEARLIEEYNQQLDNQIYDLLSKPHNNYNLEIAKLKYRNQIELLKARINTKENETAKKGGLTKFRLELAALNKQLNNAEKKLENLEKYIGDYDKERRLNVLNTNLQEASKKLEKAEENRKVEKTPIHVIKKLESYKRTTKEKRDKKANKMVLHKNGITRGQNVLVAYNMVKNKIMRTNPVENEALEEESVKTR